MGGRGKDGFPYPSSLGQALCGGRGWVPASARTMGGGAGKSAGSWDERWIVVPVFLGAGAVRGTGMGSRIREDNGRGRGSSGGAEQRRAWW